MGTFLECTLVFCERNMETIQERILGTQYGNRIQEHVFGMQLGMH